MRRDWRLEQHDGLGLVRCTTLLDVPGLAHAFSTRCADGSDDFDLGPADPAPSAFDPRRRRLCRAAGLGDGRPVVLRQVHGSRVVGVTAAATMPEADAVVACRDDPRDHPAAVRTADCVPILIADAEARAVAAVHAGWRGTAASVVRRGVDRLRELGIEPRRLRVALGPAVGPCCYEVSEEVSRVVAQAAELPQLEIARAVGGTKRRLDLHAANRRQLELAGVESGAISGAPWCTACSPELFFSYRRQGRAAGRMMACIGWSTP